MKPLPPFSPVLKDRDAFARTLFGYTAGDSPSIEYYIDAPGKCTLLQKSDPNYEHIGASILKGKYSSTDSKPSIEDFCGMQPLLSHALQARG